MFSHVLIRKEKHFLYVSCDCKILIICYKAVSYTHLDVYKRQLPGRYRPITLLPAISKVFERLLDVYKRQ